MHQSGMIYQAISKAFTIYQYERDWGPIWHPWKSSKVKAAVNQNEHKRSFYICQIKYLDYPKDFWTNTL